MLYTKEKLEKLQSRWLTPKGKKLVKKIKETRCYLSPILYRKVVQNFPYINDDEVAEEIDLRGISLAGFDFRVPVLEDDSGFEEELAIISYIHFEGANLRHTTFQDGKIMNCHFDDADLSHSNFKNATINTCSLQRTNLTGALLINMSVMSCNFSKAKLFDVNLGSMLVNQATIFDKHLQEEHEKNYQIASTVYKQLKDMYKNSSLHSIADKFHYREMVCKRRTLKWHNPMRWLNFIFGDLSCKYGTSISRITFWMIMFIASFAGCFYWLQNVRYYNNTYHLSWFDSLYFSLVTFTTVGYGDLHAIGKFKMLAGLEALTGLVIISLFTVIIARKIIRN